MSLDFSKYLNMSEEEGRKQDKKISKKMDNMIYNNEIESLKRIQKKENKKSKSYAEGNIINGSSELKKKGDKYSVDTELNIKEDLDPKVKRALKKSIIEELNKNFDEYEFFYEKKN
jgi:hypothetical protein